MSRWGFVMDGIGPGSVVHATSPVSKNSSSTSNCLATVCTAIVAASTRRSETDGQTQAPQQPAATHRDQWLQSGSPLLVGSIRDRGHHLQRHGSTDSHSNLAFIIMEAQSARSAGVEAVN